MNPSQTTFEEALRSAIDALGGLKVVGYRLRPHMDPVLAGQWLAHTLDPERREKLELGQIAWILQHAKAKGAHAAFESIATLAGYRVTAIVTPEEVVADLARQIQAHSEAVTNLSAECFERIRHANPAFASVVTP